MATPLNPADIVIRPYKESDELEWLNLHALVVVDSYAWWIAIHKKPVYESSTIDLVAVLDGKLIGFITMEIRAKFAKPHEAGFVWEFGVHRDYRKNNVGRMLIDASHVQMYREYGLSKSLWYTQDDNAKGYYRHLGMRVFSEHWQFCIRPDEKIKHMMKEDGVECWEIRASCSPEHFEKIRGKYDVIATDDTIKPRMCLGFMYDHPIENV